MESAMSAKHLNQIELSRRWSLSPRTLERWRWLGQGCRYMKIGGRVVYPLAEVEAFEAAVARQHRRDGGRAPLMMSALSLVGEVDPARGYAETDMTAHRIEASTLFAKKYLQFRKRNGAQSCVETPRFLCDILLAMNNAPLIVTVLPVEPGRRPM